MTHGERAYLEALLEGIALPATRRDLIQHARREGSRSDAKLLKRLPDRRYRSIDDIGEHLRPVQPDRTPPRRVPKPESDLPPGGPLYGTTAGAVTAADRERQAAGAAR